MDPPHIVKHIAEFYRIRLILNLELVRFSHGISGIRRLSASKWEASTLPRGNAWNACQPDIIIIRHFLSNVKFVFPINPFAVYIPQAKAWGFDGGVLRNGFQFPVKDRERQAIRRNSHSYQKRLLMHWRSENFLDFQGRND